MELETKRAGVLELQPVNQQALLDIIVDLGGVEAVTTQNYADIPKAIAASNRMLTYCFGWGVANDPPAEALETLVALGKPVHLAPIARANWLRYLALDNDEASAIVTAVMKLTFGDALGS